jgi:glucosamine 6-phosphate synthetase-like amidotransferase/phosphosugar isomerase protein
VAGRKIRSGFKDRLSLLNIKALSANQVLSQLQHDAQSLHLGKDSIVLAISQSGQTFPTLQATNAFEKLYQSGRSAGYLS